MRRLFAAAVLISMAALAACGDKEDEMVDQERVESVAAEARASIDKLAALVGSRPQVQDDVMTDCVPGDRESGTMLSYGVKVSITDDALDRLSSEIADSFEGDGWTVKRETYSNRVRFQRGNATIGATIFPGRGFAVVSGSGGCVK